MTAVKENSTRNFNKGAAALECPVTYVLNKIGGHWKRVVIYHLLPRAKRYHELKKAIPAITEKMLIQNLKQLESDNLVKRKVLQIVPPYVEYSLTESGEDLGRVLKSMCEWAIKDCVRVPEDIYGILEKSY